MTGHQGAGADAVGELEHGVDPHVAVADHARVRGGAGAIAVDECAHDLGAEALLEVERQVRDAELMRDAARTEDGKGRAAALRGVRALVGPELDGDGHDLRPALALAQRSDGRVDAAAERHEDALAFRGRCRHPAA